MPEYTTVTVIFFRIKDNKYYFYLTKKGPNLPIMPSSWTPVGSIITKEDSELYSLLRDKYGDIAPDMLKRLTALRIIFERNLFHTDTLEKVDVEADVYEIIRKIDPDLLNLWLHSMIPCGFQKFQAGDNIFKTNYFLFISPSNPKRGKMKLKRSTTIFGSTSFVLEEKANWFSAEEIYTEYNNFNRYFTNSMSTLATKIVKEYKKPLEAAREMEQKIGVAPCSEYQLFPYIWRLSTPAPTLPPYNTTNIFVVGNEHKYIIDPGSTDMKAMEPLLAFIEYNKDTMEGILLTNAFPDHCNQAQFLSEKYYLPISTSKENADILAKEGFNFLTILQEGMKIPLGIIPELNKEDWYLETLELPGSSKGSIGFWDTRGLLFSGITLHKDLTTTTSSYSASYSDFMNSLKKIKKLKPRFVLSGHGLTIAEVNKTVRMNKEMLKQIEQRMVSGLKKGISEIDELTEIAIDTRTSEWRFYMKRIVISALEKLVNDEKVTKIGSDYIWRKKKSKVWK
jgi:glyoxylase-like metal-dependent hydrolase (beta-lactamase superfamily II)